MKGVLYEKQGSRDDANRILMCEKLDVELKYNEITAPLRWDQIFGNVAPVDIEIGFGKCSFLIDIAQKQSSVNFLGIEVSRKYYQKGIKKIQTAETKNVRLLWGEAFHIFNRYVCDESVANIYINFPDPWPKKRHAKRRLLNAEFVSLAAQKLLPGGCLELATDVAAYMENSLALFHKDEQYDVLYCSNTREHHGARRQYMSDYEREFLKDGKILHYAKFQKNGSSATL